MAMIVRSWRGRASRSNASSYVEFFSRKVLPILRGIDGFAGVSLLKQHSSSDVEFLVLTRWASLDAIRAFAGDDIRKAVVEPEAAALLVAFDPTVEHFEVVEEVVSR
jgi:heme-degrading monooxygenase HmoA